MGYTNEGNDDWEKLTAAFAELTSVFGSVDSVLEAFGLLHMPAAQRYGILFGILTFVCTVTTVLCLLIWGGSFQRIQQQAETGQATLLSPTDARKQRALLLEQLLASRDYLLQRNYPDPPAVQSSSTPLTTLLANVAPKSAHELPALLLSGQVKQHEAKLREIRASMPEQYEEAYKRAYRACQDAPGGGALAGRPEARYEAYARAYAGCGHSTATPYRRSYARLYEATACHSLAADDTFSQLFQERPADICGRHCRLEMLDAARHLDDFYKLTNGEPHPEWNQKSYDPDQVWGFLPEGPFASKDALAQSFVFERRTNNEAAFAIRQHVTNQLVGIVILTDDQPAHLSVALQAPIVPPHWQGTACELEACFLLLDRLLGGYLYRRLQYSTDRHDAAGRKLATRLGMTLEGVLYKHQIVKESSRDSNVYGMLNSDWKNGGARHALFTKLYGKKAAQADKANEAKEAERQDQEEQLARLKEQEAKDAATKLTVGNDNNKKEDAALKDVSNTGSKNNNNNNNKTTTTTTSRSSKKP